MIDFSIDIGISIGYLYLMMVRLSTYPFQNLINMNLGCHHLERRSPRNFDLDVEQAKHDRRDPQSSPRTRKFSHCLARYSQETIW